MSDYLNMVRKAAGLPTGKETNDAGPGRIDSLGAGTHERGNHAVRLKNTAAARSFEQN